MISLGRYACILGAAVALVSIPASAQNGGGNPSWMNDEEFWVAPPPGSMKVFHDYSNMDWMIIGTIPIDGINWSTVTTTSSPYNIGAIFTDCDGTSYQSGRIYPHESISYYENVKTC